MLKKLIGYYLILVAVVVAAHTIFEPLYHVSTETQPYSAAWNVINLLMIAALILGIIFSFRRKAALIANDEPVTREYLSANIIFYGFLFVGILFFWNWFNLHSPQYAAIGTDTVAVVWIIIDAALPLLTGAMGVQLVRSSD